MFSMKRGDLLCFVLPRQQFNFGDKISILCRCMMGSISHPWTGYRLSPFDGTRLKCIPPAVCDDGPMRAVLCGEPLRTKTRVGYLFRCCFFPLTFGITHNPTLVQCTIESNVKFEKRQERPENTHTPSFLFSFEAIP